MSGFSHNLGEASETFKFWTGNVKEKIGNPGQNKILDTVWAKTHTELVKRTPRRTGSTRRHWQKVQPSDPQAREVVNTSLVMLYLEEGTRAHGPVVGEFLYFKDQNGQLIRKKWVNGIEAKHIVADAIPELQQMMIATIQDAIRSIENGE